ncbi:MAG: L-seryl-tRNA(Sec) selenium transferase, partial [Dehalococcoidia bacterium]|nr:L-seryl-tRNA(Sec) selenium transferase [Dehalococcoidia bacterium]
MQSQFRALPGVDKVLSDKRIAMLGSLASREVLTQVVQQRIEQARSCITSGAPCPSFEQIVSDVEETVRGLVQVGPRPVINATGVIIHTNLGRAPLSREAIEAMRNAACGYSDLEFDVEEGKRDSRHAHVERLLCHVTGAEAGFAVNNNAG